MALELRNRLEADLGLRLSATLVWSHPTILALVTHFVDKFSRKMGKRIHVLPPETMAALRSYEWPGNIRELQNLIERAVILANDGVLPNPLPPTGTDRITTGTDRVTTAPPAPTTLKDTERTLILRTLESVGWKIGGSNGAAAKLGVQRTTLINKMKRLGISRPGRDDGDTGLASQWDDT